MKKLFLCVALALFAFTANAQDSKFSVGANVGFPMGNTSNAYSFSFGVDVTYMMTSGEEFNYGVASGFQMLTGKTIGTFKIPTYSFIPIAAAGRYPVSDKFVVGADLGYAVATASGANGGFYYKPSVAYTMSDSMAVNAFYSGISANGGSISSFGVGIMYKL